MTEHVVIYPGRGGQKRRGREDPGGGSARQSDGVRCGRLYSGSDRGRQTGQRADLRRSARRGGQPGGMAEAVQWGANGIQTDRPEELVKFLRENG